MSGFPHSVLPASPGSGYLLESTSDPYGYTWLSPLPSSSSYLSAAVDVAATTATQITTLDLSAGRWLARGVVDLLIPAGTALGAVDGVVWLTLAGQTVFSADWMALQALSALGSTEEVEGVVTVASASTLALMVYASSAVTAETTPSNYAAGGPSTGLFAIQLEG